MGRAGAVADPFRRSRRGRTFCRSPHLPPMPDFHQSPPRLGNQYEDDRVLRSWLRRALPDEVRRDIEPGLLMLGARAAGDILASGDAAEASPPRHVPYDAWGRR